MQIHTTLASTKEGRDVWALVTEDNLVEYGWIFTRIELDPDQLCGHKSGPKKLKTDSKSSIRVAPLKKATASRLLKMKSAASSSKKPAFSKSAAPPPPAWESEDEDEAPLEPL